MSITPAQIEENAHKQSRKVKVLIKGEYIEAKKMEEERQRLVREHLEAKKMEEERQRLEREQAIHAAKKERIELENILEKKFILWREKYEVDDDILEKLVNTYQFTKQIEEYIDINNETERMR